MKNIILAVMVVIACPVLAMAQSTEKNLMANDGWAVTAGTAYLYTPAFLGSKDYYSQLVPVVRLNYKDKFFASMDEGVGYNVINNSQWRVGPIAKYQFARSDKDSDGMFRIGGKKTTALNGLDAVGGSLELGGFAEYTMMDHIKPYVELRQAVNGHEGFRGDVRVNYENQVGYVMYAFGPRMSFTDNRYNDAYFNIDGAASGRTGLAQYNPDGGILSYGFGGRVIVPFSEQIAAVVFGGYDRLGHEPAGSSLVTERGSKNQVTAGLALVYRKKF